MIASTNEIPSPATSAKTPAGNVLSAADAVQVRVLHPDRSDAVLAQLGETATEIRPGAHLLTHVASLFSTSNAAPAMSTIAAPPSSGSTAPFTRR
jgi:hypothetical protein